MHVFYRFSTLWGPRMDETRQVWGMGHSVTCSVLARASASAAFMTIDETTSCSTSPCGPLYSAADEGHCGENTWLCKEKPMHCKG